MKATFIERTLSGLLAASEYSAAAEDAASVSGLFQRLDPRVKLIGLFALVIVTVASRRLSVILAVLAACLILSILSRISIKRLLVWVWAPALFFTGVIAIPALFLTPGQAIGAIRGITITAQGLRSAAFLILRAETCVTLSALLVFTTPWPRVLKALRTLGCPMVAVAILGMTYRYIFVVLQIAAEMFESRRSRTVGNLPTPERRRLMASTVGVLLSKSIQLSDEIHLAMSSRGFRGETYILQDFRTDVADRVWLVALLSLAFAGFWWGR